MVLWFSIGCRKWSSGFLLVAENGLLVFYWLQNISNFYSIFMLPLLYELQHNKTNKMICAPSEDSDQPGHLPSLIRVFAVCSMDSWGSSASSCSQRRLWSDWAASKDSDQTGRQARTLSPHRAHRSFCWFCHEVAYIASVFKTRYQIYHTLF